MGRRSAKRPTMAMVTASTRPDGRPAGRPAARYRPHRTPTDPAPSACRAAAVGRSEQGDAVDEGHDAAHGETVVAKHREVHERRHRAVGPATMALEHAPLQHHKAHQSQRRTAQEDRRAAGAAMQGHQTVEQAQRGQQPAGPVQRGAARIGCGTARALVGTTAAPATTRPGRTAPPCRRSSANPPAHRPRCRPAAAGSHSTRAARRW